MVKKNTTEEEKMVRKEKTKEKKKMFRKSKELEEETTAMIVPKKKYQCRNVLDAEKYAIAPRVEIFFLISAGVLPAIKFTHTFVSEMCKDAALAKEFRDLSLCSVIPIPGYYKNNMKKYGIRKSRTYKGKSHNSHVKPFKRKYKDDRGRVKKSKCFICGKEGHFAKDCRSKQGNITRSAVYQELDLDDN
ncbi:Orf y [Tanacetum coccineum]